MHVHQRPWHRQWHGDPARGLHQRRHGRVLHGGVSGHLHHHHDPERHTPLHDEQPPEEDREGHQRVLPHGGRRETAEGLRDRQADPHHHLGQDAGAGQGHPVQDHGVRPLHRGVGPQHPAAAAHHELPHLHGGDPGGGGGGGDEAHLHPARPRVAARRAWLDPLHRRAGRLHHPAGEGQRAQRVAGRRLGQLVRSRAAAADRHPGIRAPSARRWGLLRVRGVAAIAVSLPLPLAVPAVLPSASGGATGGARRGDRQPGSGRTDSQ